MWERRKRMAQRGISQAEIAEAEDVSEKAIEHFFRARGVKMKELRPVNLMMNGGYERWQHDWDGERFRFPVHRLAAIAWFGIDAVKGKDIHHVNGIPWDTREDNLEVLSVAEHNATHRHYENLLSDNPSVDTA